MAYAISKPTVFLAGRYDAFSGYQITEGYYAQWFSDGYGFINYRNVHQNGTSNYDVMAYDKQLGFTITDEPAQADVIVGNVALNQGESGAAAVAAVKAGGPLHRHRHQPPEVHPGKPDHRSGVCQPGHGGPAHGGVSHRPA